MEGEVRRDVQGIQHMNEKILKNLKTQKIVHEGALEQLQELLENEIKIPSNRYLAWCRLLINFINALNLGKSIDLQIIEAYNAYIQDLIEYEQDYNSNEEKLEEVGFSYDRLVDSTLFLESRLIQLKRDYNENLVKIQQNAQTLYKQLPKNAEKNGCTGCGGNFELNTEGICRNCEVLWRIDQQKKAKPKEVKLKRGRPPKKEPKSAPFRAFSDDDLKEDLPTPEDETPGEGQEKEGAEEEPKEIKGPPLKKSIEEIELEKKDQREIAKFEKMAKKFEEDYGG